MNRFFSFLFFSIGTQNEKKKNAVSLGQINDISQGRDKLHRLT